MPFPGRPFVAFALLLGLSSLPVSAEPTRETPAWFREARFGLFIHWGVYAWRAVTLGEIELPAGETSFDLRGGSAGIVPVSFRRLWVSPVR